MLRPRANSPHDEAVSPIVSTLLMVALTVVLVVAILMVISGYSTDGSSAPAAVAWTMDDDADRIILRSAQGHSDWARLAVHVAECDQSADYSVGRVGATEGISNGKYFNEPADPSGAALNEGAPGASCGSGVLVPLADALAPAWADDYLEFCADGGPMSTVTIEIVDTAANAMIHKATFIGIAAC